MTRRFKPKDWLRPRSRRWREELDLDGEPLTSVEVLKAIYIDTRRPPDWAVLANKRGWMTDARFYRLPEKYWVRIPSIYQHMTYDSPIFGLIPKSSF